MKKLTTSKTSSKLPTLIHNESGVIFPYVLMLMMIASSYILMTWQDDQEQVKHIQLLNKQETIQNLIQISLHELYVTLDQLELTREKQNLEFKYNTGDVAVSYYLITDNTLRIELEVTLKNTTDPPYKHTLAWNV